MTEIKITPLSADEAASQLSQLAELVSGLSLDVSFSEAEGELVKSLEKAAQEMKAVGDALVTLYTNTSAQTKTGSDEFVATDDDLASGYGTRYK